MMPAAKVPTMAPIVLAAYSRPKALLSEFDARDAGSGSGTSRP